MTAPTGPEPAIPSAAGKRLSTDEPLTEHDVAERLSKAALRLLRLLVEFRELGMVEVCPGVPVSPSGAAGGVGR